MQVLARRLAPTILFLSSWWSSDAAAQAPVVELSGSQLLSISIGVDSWPAGRLTNGTSTGAVEFAGQGGGPIGAADDFDLDSYFSRNASVAPEWDVDLGDWLDPDPGKADFFVLEAGGNDFLDVRPRFLDGTYGQATPLSGWEPTAWTLTSGPNALQTIEVLAFSFEDLRDVDGSGLPVGKRLSGLRFESSTIDGAVFVATTDGPILAAVPPPDLSVAPQAIPFNDSNQTQVTLTAEPYASGALASNSYELEWIVPGATFESGTTASDPTAVVSFGGSDQTTVELRVWPVGQPNKAHVRRFEIGLLLPTGVELHGSRTAYQPMELWFYGPPASALDNSPHPFLDRRLDLVLLDPQGVARVVPGFYDGDGRGSLTGGVWKVRLTPEQEGGWTFLSSFRVGTNVAIDASLNAGAPGSIHGLLGTFWVKPPDPEAEGFHARGTLRSTDTHYQQFDDGSWFLKGGVGGPENLLAFEGFEDVQKKPGSLGVIHGYQPHLFDWTPDSGVVPNWTWAESRAIFGALDYLESVGINSLYFLPMNLGGDGWDTAPFVGYDPTAYNRTRYHTGRLLQWNAVFEHAQKRGLHLQFVLAETEFANETWLDNGAFGDERKLFFREMVARFSHHNALKWNLSEENDYPVADLEAMAERIRQLDSYDHTIAVHNKPGVYSFYEAIKGDPRFDATSIQYNPDNAGARCEEWRIKSANAGNPWVLDMDENTPAIEGLSATNASDLRRRALWDIYLSGGQLEWYLGAHPLPIGGDQDLEDFRTREEMWNYTRIAREFVEALPFTEMEPSDALLNGEGTSYGGGEVFAIQGEVYAVYLPESFSTGSLNLFNGVYRTRWFDPREGVFVGPDQWLTGPGAVPLGAPPSDPGLDWVVLLERATFWPDINTISVTTGGAQQLFFDGDTPLGNLGYIVLGSLSGTSPVAVWPGVLDVPLVIDGYFWMTLTSPSLTTISNGTGVLDGGGKTNASFLLAPNPGSSLIGYTVHHSLVVPFANPGFSSNPVGLTFQP